MSPHVHKDSPRRHWTDSSFQVVSETHENEYGCQSGYCRNCKADMQRFWDKTAWGPLKHYNSHGTARRLGLWGTR